MKDLKSIAKSIINSKTKEEAKKYLKDNVSFSSGNFSNTLVSPEIVNSWTYNNELYNIISRTPYSKFFYTTQDIDDTNAKAQGWSKTSTDPKAIQELTVSPKTIQTGYIYKRQYICQEDLDDLNDSGNYDEFLEFITLELRRHVEDSIIGNIIGGAFSQDYSSASNKYERFVIGETDSKFTTVKTKTQSGSSDYTYITVDNVQEMCDTVLKTNVKWLVIHPADFRALMDDSEVYSETMLATLLGVDYIFQTLLAERGKVICLDPTQYVIKVKNEINVAYPAYEYNKLNLQYEVNAGGIIKGLKSSGMLVGSLMTY